MRSWEKRRESFSEKKKKEHSGSFSFENESKEKVFSFLEFHSIELPFC